MTDMLEGALKNPIHAPVIQLAKAWGYNIVGIYETMAQWEYGLHVIACNYYLSKRTYTQDELQLLMQHDVKFLVLTVSMEEPEMDFWNTSMCVGTIV